MKEKIDYMMDMIMDYVDDDKGQHTRQAIRAIVEEETADIVDDATAPLKAKLEECRKLRDDMMRQIVSRGAR